MTAKQGYNQGIVERYFNKLPDPLGSIIFKEYKKETNGSISHLACVLLSFVFNLAVLAPLPPHPNCNQCLHLHALSCAPSTSC